MRTGIEIQFRQLRINGKVIEQHRAIGDAFLSPTFPTYKRLHQWLYKRGLIGPIDEPFDEIKILPKRKLKIKLNALQRN